MLFTASWKRLKEMGFYSYISDQEIEQKYDEANKEGKFIDTMIPWNFNDPIEHHTKRIASLVNMIKTGKTLDIVTLICSKDISNHWYTLDGCHRIRAYIFLKQDMPCIMKIEP